MFGEPTLADAILDRIVHSAHRLQLKGDSLRKQKMPKIAVALPNATGYGRDHN